MNSPPKPPKPPSGLKTGGSAFWTAVVEKFELVDHELLVLKECCRTVDLLDDLQASLDQDGPVLPWGEGVRAHPAAPELRQHRVALARLLAVLSIPADDEDRSHVRGSRGVYRMGSTR
jgi:hypothetical protein